jgi:very-short-patch-repair endonuclease
VRGLVRQHRVQLPGHGEVRFDLAIPELNWAIEIDLHPRHRETLGITADARRDRAADAIGWMTTRISKHDYDVRFNETIGGIASLHHDLRRRAG